MYELAYDPKINLDLKRLGGAEKKRIKQAISQKLIHNPTLYGKPLQHSLNSLRSFRVGEYRVIFKIDTNCLFIVHIGHRKGVYPQAQKRIT